VPFGEQMPDWQSEPLKHGPPGGWPQLFVPGSQKPDRHSALLGGGPQGSPFLRPQRLSLVSHAPARQTRVPIAAVQTPLTPVPLMFGMGCPFGVLAVHTPSAHHCVEVQSVSDEQKMPHEPLVVLQSEPAGSPVQSLFVVHLPHSPWFGPLVWQNGLADVGHACVAFVPKSPLHGAHVCVVTSHVGVGPMQRTRSFVEHWPHAPFPRQAGCVVEGQGRSAVVLSLLPVHVSHWCVPVLQTGCVLAGLHCAFDRHCTHWLIAVLQTRPRPGHGSSVAEHWRHTPLTHAGFGVGAHLKTPGPLALLFASALQPVQVLFAVLQNAVGELHVVLSMHWTQAWLLHTVVAVPAQSAFVSQRTHVS
jgi:hypothetical protein